MFGLFKKKPIEPPSRNQVVLCEQLGLVITDKMSRKDVSDLLAVSLKQDKYKKIYDEIQRAREEEYEREEREEYGDELVNELRKWEELCDSGNQYIMLFKRGSKVQADVAEFEMAEIAGTKKFSIELSIILPKLHRDKDMGDYLDWDRDITIKANNILKFVPLTESIDEYDIEKYESIKNNFISENSELV